MLALSGLLTDSLEAFWPVVEQLESGKPVNERAWDALFRTSGYQALAPEFPPSVLRSLFEIVFSRGRGEEARAIAGHDGLAAHYFRVKEERHGIQTFVAHLDVPRLFSNAMRQTSLWLPPETTKGAPLPIVALAVFGPDARGYDPVVVDAGLARRLGETNLVLLLAHEFHHWFRNRAKGIVATIPEDLAWVFDQIQAEGIADQINVPTFLGEGGPTSHIWPGWADRYRNNVQQAPAFLTEMDRLLTHIVRSPERGEQEVRCLKELLPMAGHPVGYHMSCRIIQAGMREALISSYAKPFEFFPLYAKACQAHSTACELSQTSLAYLESLRTQ